MPSQRPILDSRVVELPDLTAERRAPLQGALSRFEQAIGQAQLDVRDVAARVDFTVARREVAELLLNWPRKERAEVSWEALRRVISRLGASGLQDAPWDEEDEVLAGRMNLSRWTDLLARMVLGPMGRGGLAPRFADVGDEWWGLYAEWAFQAPQGFVTTGQAEAYARQYLPLVRELAEWVERNAGSPTVRAAAEAYLRVSNQIPLYFTAGSLREHAAARGRILARLVADRSTPFDGFALPREGRRLRVGVVNRHFGPQTETYTTLPSFEALDPERFEVMLFACRSDNSPLERYCRAKASSFEVLPQDLAGQLSVLRAAALDVVVWGTNLTAVVNEITRLALHRVAPLQVVNNSSCITSGLSESDLYVSGELTEADDAPGHFTERLGLLPGPTHAFNYEADRQAPAREWTKADLGIPSDAFVFVSAANYFKVIPEVREAWARLLAAVPGSRLLLHPFNPNWSSSYPIQRFCAEFEQVLERHGVDHDRLVISTMKLPSRSDVGALMAVGDLYLDTAPFGGVNSLIDPLEHGVPVVAWQGDTMRARMGAAVLRSVGLEDCVALDEASYLELARSLALDSEARAALSARIRSAMERAPMFMDPLAASDVFGSLIETAFDELAEKGPRVFRASSAPLRARQPVALTVAERRELGNRLVREGRTGRGVEYLLAALQKSDADAGLWLDVARALRANRQHNEALQALEAALRLNEALVEGWTMMAEIAEERGNEGLAAEARAVVDRLRPRPRADVSGVMAKLRSR